MKNIIKLLSILLVSSFGIYLASAGYNATLSIKKLGNESFSDEATLNSSGDTFVMNISLVPFYDKKTRVDISGLPTGITPKSFAIDGETCGNNINNIDYNQTNNVLTFTYTPAASSICVITTEYTTNGVAAGDYVVKPTLTDSVNNVFGDVDDVISDGNKIDIKVSALVQITEADSIDIDADGFIDGYDLKFNKNPGTALSPAQLSIRSEEKIATNIAYNSGLKRITFQDGIFTTGEKPLIEITSNAGGYEKMKYSVEIHNDTASPKVTSYTNTEIEKTDNMTVVFNEKMKSAETIAATTLKLGINAVDITTTYNEQTNTLIIDPNSDLNAGTNYILAVSNSAIDWEGNGLPNFSVTVGVKADPVPPTPTPSGGGGGGGGGGGSINRDYESKSYFYNKKLSLEEAINQDEKIFGRIKITKKENGKTDLTKSGESIRLYGNSGQVSNLFIGENTTISYPEKWDGYLYPFLKYGFNDSKIKAQEYLNLDGKKLKTYSADSIGFVGAEGEILSLNKDATIEIKLERVYSSDSYYVFYSDSLDGEFKPVKNIPFTVDKKTGKITVKTDKLGYFVVIRGKYYTGKSVSPTGDSSGTGNIKPKFSSLTEAKNATLLKVENTKLSVFIDKYYDYLRLNENKNLDYYLSFDKELRDENNKVINNFYDFFTGVEEYLEGKKDKDFEDKLIEELVFLEKEKKERKNIILEKKYVDIVTELDDSVIYRVKEAAYQKAFKVLENKFVGKIRALRDNENISEEEYQTALSAYNDLVLNFAIYKQYNELEEAYNRVIDAIIVLNKTYKKKVIYKPVVVEEQKLYVKDIYSLTKTLKTGDYNDEVRNLQNILKMYGYFDYDATGYFGRVTKSSLIKFAKDKLDYTSNGILTDDLREKILNLEIIEK